jgi:hypothetical protein
VEWIGTADMVADGLTKALGQNKFEDFVTRVGLCPLSESGFRGSEIVNPDHEWTVVKWGRQREKSLRKNSPS